MKNRYGISEREIVYNELKQLPIGSQAWEDKFQKLMSLIPQTPVC